MYETGPYYRNLLKISDFYCAFLSFFVTVSLWSDLSDLYNFIKIPSADIEDGKPEHTFKRVSRSRKNADMNCPSHDLSICAGIAPVLPECR
ncbi:hypothetical protein DV872_13830 [Oceanispirochaeta sp. M1]|nr:hypothetical protein DV872_13830 [Oceanispirochaeta sp. M1]